MSHEGQREVGRCGRAMGGVGGKARRRTDEETAEKWVGLEWQEACAQEDKSAILTY